MFERFTDRARRVVVLAQEEARLLFHDHIGTEHLLLGLVAEGHGIAAQALDLLDVTTDRARQQVKEIVGVGEVPPSAHIPLTPRAKQVLESSVERALQLGHKYIGTEHFLLGMIAEGDGVAMEVLRRLDVDPEDARDKVIELLANRTPPEPGTLLTRADHDPPAGAGHDPALVSLLFAVVALVAVVIQPPTPQIRLWGLSLLLGGVLVWAGGAIIGTAAGSGPRSRGMGRLLRVLAELTMAAAASVFVLGALLV